MKSITKAALAFALIFCLAASFAACNDSDDYDDRINYLTELNGETVTDTDGEPVTEEKNSESNTTDGGNNENNNGGSSSGNIQNSGANTEGGWGELITPN